LSQEIIPNVLKAFIE